MNIDQYRNRLCVISIWNFQIVDWGYGGQWHSAGSIPHKICKLIIARASALHWCSDVLLTSHTSSCLMQPVFWVLNCCSKWLIFVCISLPVLLVVIPFSLMIDIFNWRYPILWQHFVYHQQPLIVIATCSQPINHHCHGVVFGHLTMLMPQYSSFGFTHNSLKMLC